MNEVNDQNEKVFADNDHVANIPVIEEFLQIDKRVIDKGTIRIIKKVDEEIVVVPLMTRSKQYSIERISVDKYVEEAPEPVRYEGNTMVISIVEEEIVIQKRLKVVEELRITTSETEIITDTSVVLKKERVVVERDPEESNNK